MTKRFEDLEPGDIVEIRPRLIEGKTFRVRPHFPTGSVTTEEVDAFVTLTVRKNEFRLTVYDGPDGILEVLFRTEAGRILHHIEHSDLNLHGIAPTGPNPNWVRPNGLAERYRNSLKRSPLTCDGDLRLPYVIVRRSPNLRGV